MVSQCAWVKKVDSRDGMGEMNILTIGMEAAGEEKGCERRGNWKGKAGLSNRRRISARW